MQLIANNSSLNVAIGFTQKIASKHVGLRPKQVQCYINIYIREIQILTNTKYCGSTMVSESNATLICTILLGITIMVKSKYILVSKILADYKM